MPSLSAVLRDITDFNLDPSQKFDRIASSGRLAKAVHGDLASKQAELVEEIGTVNQSEDASQHDVVDEVVVRPVPGHKKGRNKKIVVEG